MNIKSVKSFPWLSLGLLLIAFASFGWFLAGTKVPITDVPFGLAESSFISEARLRLLFPRFVLLMAVGLILLLSTAFMHPIVSFNRFITHWFTSDAVAFLTVLMLVTLTAIVLFWLHIFLYVLTIAATEALARIDIQACGFKEHHAFLLLTLCSSIGLLTGWTTYAIFY